MVSLMRILLARLLLALPSLALVPQVAYAFSLPNSHCIRKTSSPASSKSCLNLSTELMAGVAIAGGAFWLYVESAPNRVLERQNRRRRREEETRYQEWQEEKKKLAYVEPKEYWTESELREYDGSNNEDGPILFAADGLVFNAYKGRNFYGPGGEYHIFAGRDATRLLARTIVEEETEEEAKKPLTMAERAALAGWMWTFKNKYDIVGKLEGFDESTTSMRQ